MPRLLALSDVHERITIISRVIRLFDFDILILAGDIAELEALQLASLLKSLNKAVVAISGNHDCFDCFGKLSKKIPNFYYLKESVISLEIDGSEFRIAGLSGIYKKKKPRRPIYFGDRDILAFIRTIKDYLGGAKLDLLITHTPPYRYSDFLPKGGRGGLKQFLPCFEICAPRYWVTGHTHVLAVEKSPSGFVVNCGLGYFGDWVFIDTEAGEIIVGRIIDEDTSAIMNDLDGHWDFAYFLRKTKSFRRLMLELSERI